MEKLSNFSRWKNSCPQCMYKCEWCPQRSFAVYFHNMWCLEALYFWSYSLFYCEIHNWRGSQKKRYQLFPTLSQFEAFIALQYGRGLYGKIIPCGFSKTKEYGISVFSKTMPRDRFLKISNIWDLIISQTDRGLDQEQIDSRQSMMYFKRFIYVPNKIQLQIFPYYRWATNACKISLPLHHVHAKQAQQIRD